MDDFLGANNSVRARSPAASSPPPAVEVAALPRKLSKLDSPGRVEVIFQKKKEDNNNINIWSRIKKMLFYPSLKKLRIQKIDLKVGTFRMIGLFFVLESAFIGVKGDGAEGAVPGVQGGGVFGDVDVLPGKEMGDLPDLQLGDDEAEGLGEVAEDVEGMGFWEGGQEDVELWLGGALQGAVDALGHAVHLQQRAEV